MDVKELIECVSLLHVPFNAPSFAASDSIRAACGAQWPRVRASMPDEAGSLMKVMQDLYHQPYLQHFRREAPAPTELGRWVPKEVQMPLTEIGAFPEVENPPI